MLEDGRGAGSNACQQMLSVGSWGSASGTGYLDSERSQYSATGNRETPQRTGIAQKWDGSQPQIKGCATSKGSSIIRLASADLSHYGGQ